MKNITTQQHTSERYMNPDEIMAREARFARVRTLEKQPGMFARIITVMHNKTVGKASLNMGKNFVSSYADRSDSPAKVDPAVRLAADRVMGTGDFAPLREKVANQDEYTRTFNQIGERVASQPLESPIDQQAARKLVEQAHSAMPAIELEIPEQPKVAEKPVPVLPDDNLEQSGYLIDEAFRDADVDEILGRAEELRSQNDSTLESV